MITTLEGQLARKADDHLVVNLGGIGIEVIAPFSTLESLQTERVFLYTRLVVREDSLTLYGFATVAERELFDAVLKISGIGPQAGCQHIKHPQRREYPQRLSPMNARRSSAAYLASARRQRRRSCLSCKTSSRLGWIARHKPAMTTPAPRSWMP